MKTKVVRIKIDMSLGVSSELDGLRIPEAKDRPSAVFGRPDDIEAVWMAIVDVLQKRYPGLIDEIMADGHTNVSLDYRPRTASGTLAKSRRKK